MRTCSCNFRVIGADHPALRALRTADTLLMGDLVIFSHPTLGVISGDKTLAGGLFGFGLFRSSDDETMDASANNDHTEWQ
jgi:hypothetical protein